jgi:hypothetical protein
MTNCQIYGKQVDVAFFFSLLLTPSLPLLQLSIVETAAFARRTCHNRWRRTSAVAAAARGGRGWNCSHMVVTRLVEPPTDAMTN